MKNKLEKQKPLESEKTETRSVLIGVMSLEQLAPKPVSSGSSNQPERDKLDSSNPNQG